MLTDVVKNKLRSDKNLAPPRNEQIAYSFGTILAVVAEVACMPPHKAAGCPWVLKESLKFFQEAQLDEPLADRMVTPHPADRGKV